MHVESKGSIKLGNEILHPFDIAILMRGCWVSCHNTIDLFRVEPFASSCFLCITPTTILSVVDFVMSDLGYLHSFYIICDVAPQFKNTHPLD